MINYNINNKNLIRRKKIKIKKFRSNDPRSLTQIFGDTHTRAVQTNIKTGNAINVAVSPKCLITVPVPNNENKKEIVFVVFQGVKK